MKRFLIVRFDVTDWAEEQIAWLARDAARPADGNHCYPETTAELVCATCGAAGDRPLQCCVAAQR